MKFEYELGNEFDSGFLAGVVRSLEIVEELNRGKVQKPNWWEYSGALVAEIKLIISSKKGSLNERSQF